VNNHLRKLPRSRGLRKPKQIGISIPAGATVQLREYDTTAETVGPCRSLVFLQLPRSHQCQITTYDKESEVQWGALIAAETSGILKAESTRQTEA